LTAVAAPLGAMQPGAAMAQIVSTSLRNMFILLYRQSAISARLTVRAKGVAVSQPSHRAVSRVPPTSNSCEKPLVELMTVRQARNITSPQFRTFDFLATVSHDPCLAD